MLLCDYAEEVNGKLYIMGGGWSNVLRPDAPFNVGLAIKLSVPWIEANRRHSLLVRLVTEQDEQYELGGHEVQLSAEVEVGRPPGIRPGSYLDAPFAANFQGISLPAGSYVWELMVNDRTLKRIPFDVAQLQ